MRIKGEKRDRIVEAIEDMEADVEKMRTEKQIQLADELGLDVNDIENVWAQEKGP